MKKTYSIAGLIVELTGERTLQQIVKIPGFNTFEIGDRSEANVDIHIHTDNGKSTANLTDIQPIHHFEVLDIKHSFSMCNEGYLYEMYCPEGNKIVSIIYDPNGNSVLMSPCICALYIKYAIWVAYLLPALERKVLPIHASSIVNNSQAVLFLGESGTGKSTHTKLWLQYIENSFLLNDDSPLLRINDDKIFVYGSPWSGKTHCYRKEAVPLKAIVRLSQHSENKMSHSNRLTSIGAIQPSFPPFLAYDDTFSEKVIGIIDKIVKEIPIYGLKCRPDKQAAEMAYTLIY